MAQRLRVHADVLNLEPEVHAAFERLERDEAAHVVLADEVLDALGATPPPAQALTAAKGEETPLERYVREVAVGLFVCEAVSASRFASVWAATDLPAFRQRIGLFLRDEVAHADLGALLLPAAHARLAAGIGRERARAFVDAVIDAALAELKRHVAGGLEREQLPAARAQPADNPGVVEPAVDARAYYRALDRLRRSAISPDPGALASDRAARG